MKYILKTSLLATLFILTSCAHHHCSKTCDSQCQMHKDGKKCENKDGKKEQCPMKAENKDSTTVNEDSAAKK